jgi:nicotinamidase-related amidase
VGSPLLSIEAVESFVNTALADELSKRKVKRLVISGMQSNVCVLATTLGALDRSCEVLVVEDAIAARNDELHNAAGKEMAGAGAKIVTSSSLMQ